MLEEDGHPEMNILEVEDAVMIKTCQMHDYNFTVISADDVVIPPTDSHDFI